ncbi:type I-E CRISPR-associated protein Cas7/Cse4/CasC [Pseudoclavibacter sp. 13-3]|uniref:type I-E CRISPR-associated protein Cas7/Cse4/CasC n=1 Tax=Pseudoclavibacter sp. 13-3 TaxID=2901228 RepID=UPI001E511504|nr:type I-E CRISPR-associated protein Cas7/Cse4/CasC [Pseudoclavibacter sp. 13-3]MCD7100741.1 type I-E CRISPR-associated protein Cas7/Cse4/CasC [Pseudoclavibacter sp. 13-3]
MSNRTIIDFSILQTVPPSNLNRDDTGSPKSAVYGGVLRARVSSQAWKRPTRQAFRDTLDASDLGLRTKRVAEVLAEHVAEISDLTEQQAITLAEETLKSAGIKLDASRKTKAAKAAKDSDEAVAAKAEETTYLFFLGERQYARLAELIVEMAEAEDSSAEVKGRKKDIKKILKEDHAVDIALFGRMVADDTDLNIDAAAQVAHALSVHRVNAEADYFTAVDDAKDRAADEQDSGAAMIGTVEFNSATLYRYANVDGDRLLENIGDIEATKRAVEAFAKAFVTSIPNGKINTFAHNTLPELVVISVRDTQAVNLVGAFERPVTGASRVQEATGRLVDRAKEIDAAYATTPVQTWVVRLGDETERADELGAKVSLAQAADQLGALVASRLRDRTGRQD